MTQDNVEHIKELLHKTFFQKNLDILRLRDTFENFYTSRAKINFSPQKTFTIGKIPAFLFENEKNLHNRIGIFLHAGGFTMGNTKSHWDLIALLAQESNIDIMSIDYRLAPENPFPAQLDDSLSAYNWLLEQNHAPNNIVLIGLAAGATLVLSMLLALREAKIPMPLAAIAISPITDFAFNIKDYHHNDWLPFDRLTRLKAAYINDRESNHPLISPFFGELDELPNILLQVGSDEILKNDSLKFYEKAKRTNTNIVLDVRDNLFHCAQLFAGSLPTARAAISYIGSFINQKII